jgi:hypothetical protein
MHEGMRGLQSATRLGILSAEGRDHEDRAPAEKEAGRKYRGRLG